MSATDFQRGDTFTGFFPSMSPSESFLSGLRNSSYEDSQRFARYQEFFDAYNGKHWKDVERVDNERRVTSNFCRLFVNKGASFLTSKGWYIDDKDDTYSKDQIDFLNDVWRVNNKDLLSFEMAQLGAIFGDVFLTILPNSQKGIVINTVAPMFVTPIFHPANKGLLLGAIIEYPLNTDPTAQGSRNGPGLMSIYMDSMNITQYVDGELVYSEPHGLGEVPLVFIRNRPEAASTYGTSDIAAIYDMNKLYNEKLQDISDIINYHAAPVTLAYGVRLKNLQKGARKFWAGLPSPKDAKIENLELKSDLAASNAHLKSVMDLIFTLGEMPEIAFGKTQAVSNTTGLAIQLMYQPLLDVLNIKHKSYGSGLANANRIITKYGIKFGYIQSPAIYTWLDMAKYLSTDIIWNSPLPIDELLSLNMIISRLQQGLITYDDALSQLGVSNVRRYAQEIANDVNSGRILSIKKSVNDSISNIGGILRNPSTSNTNDVLIKNS
jgi:hypothetical protein